MSIFSAAFLLSSVASAQERDDAPPGESRDPDRGPGGTRLAIDLDFADSFDDDVESGMGGALRFGREYDVLILSLTPELMGTFHTFSGRRDANQFSGMAGGRATIGKIIEPGVFAHVGAGHANLPGDDITGLAIDLGFTVDLTLIPLVDLGLHAAYDSLGATADRGFDWYRLGAHIAIAP